jgi:anti-anti-sigma factor
LEIIRKSLASIPLLEIEGDIDHASTDVFDKAARDCLDGGQRLLLDLTRCGYIDSGGLAVLIYLTRRLTPWGWLGIVVTSKNILRLFDAVGLDAYPGFRIFGSISDARHSLEAEMTG